MHSSIPLETIQQLLIRYPTAVITSSSQHLTQSVFDAQRQKHACGAIGILSNPRGQLVLVKRSGLHAGWALPGGTVDPGESFEDALRRELLEETGVLVSALQLVEIEEKRFVSPMHESMAFVLAVFQAKTPESGLPAATKGAEEEGLTAALFSLSELPTDMVMGDRSKIDKHFLRGRCEHIGRAADR